MALVTGGSSKSFSSIHANEIPKAIGREKTFTFTPKISAAFLIKSSLVKLTLPARTITPVGVVFPLTCLLMSLLMA